MSKMVDKMVKLFSDKIQLLQMAEEKSNLVSSDQKEQVVLLDPIEKQMNENVIASENLTRKLQEEMKKQGKLGMQKKNIIFEQKKGNQISQNSNNKKNNLHENQNKAQKKPINFDQAIEWDQMNFQDVENDENNECGKIQDEIIPVRFSVVLKTVKLPKGVTISFSNQEQQGNQKKSIEINEQNNVEQASLQKITSYKTKSEKKEEKKQAKKDGGMIQKNKADIRTQKIKPEQILDNNQLLEREICKIVKEQIKKISEQFKIDEDIVERIFDNREKYNNQHECQSQKQIQEKLHQNLYLFFEKNKNCKLNDLMNEANRILTQIGIPKERHESIRKQWLKQFNKSTKKT